MRILGIRIRSRCDSYEHSKKSTKFILNYEKQRGAQNTIKKLIIDDMKNTDQTHILECIRDFYETLLKNRKKKKKKKIFGRN